MAAEQIAMPVHVTVSPLRRRHLRSVLRIEAQVYPRPWSLGLFMSELALKTTRAYFVARVANQVVGYAGDNFTGTSWTFTGDTSYVGAAANDQMSSCKIQ